MIKNIFFFSLELSARTLSFGTEKKKLFFLHKNSPVSLLCDAEEREEKGKKLEFCGVREAAGRVEGIFQNESRKFVLFRGFSNV